MVHVRHAVIDTNLNNWRNQMLNYPQDHKAYVPAAATDVLATFKRLGFVPPSEIKEYQDKWAYYKSLGAL
jgi:hypothetical protein